MERILVLLGIIFSFNSFGAVPGGVPQIGLGAIGSTTSPTANVDIGNFAGGAGKFSVFSLYAGGVSLTANNFYPFYKNGVAYQVTAGKVAYCFNHTGNSGTASQYYQLISATASFAANASSITGGVFQCGATITSCNTTPSSAFIYGAIPGTYQFAASTFAGFQAFNSANFQVHLDCYEN